MEDNSGWPETFGFRIGGGRPVVIIHVDEDSSARYAGLQTGDQITELNGQNVQQLTVDELKFLAQQSAKVPPSLAVISRVKTLDVALSLGSRTSGFGFTLRGNGPVFVRNVSMNSPAREAGLRSGDLVLQVNGEEMQYASKQQIEKVVRESENRLRLVVIASGLTSLDSSNRSPVNRSRAVRYQKAKLFYQQLNYYLHGMDRKKGLLVLAMKEFARDRSVEQLAHACVSVLTTSTQRKLLKEIRSFIPPKQHAAFDVLVRMDSDIMSSPARGMGLRQGSDPNLGRTGLSGLTSPLGVPVSAQVASMGPRTVKIERGSLEFGFTLSGASPVFIRQVEKGSPADKAGLKSGDQILELNGLNVRNKSKAEVVRLLKGSGSSPSLLVEQKQAAPRIPTRASSLTELSGHSNSAGYSRQTARQQSREFQSTMATLLTARERQAVASCLEKYKNNRNVEQLVQSLSLVLTTDEKVCLMHNVCQLLPPQEQTKFDQEAAKVIGEFERKGPVRGGTGEQLEDVLYRVQGMQLEAKDTAVGRHAHHNQTRMIGVGRLDRLEAIAENDNERAVTIRPRGGSFGRGPERLSTLSGDSDCATAEVSEYGNAVPVADSISFGSSFSSSGVTFSVGTGISASETPSTGHSVQTTTLNQPMQPGTSYQSETGSILVATGGTQVDKEGRAMATPAAASSLGELLAKAKPPTAGGEETKTGSSPSVAPAPPPLPLGPGGVPPPPPLPGGVPPPPPIGGVAAQKSRLKQVNWEKLSVGNLQDTVWAQLSTSSELEELLELDEQFASGPQRKGIAAKKDENMAILESKKSYNISILIGHLKLPFEDIRDAVLAMDDSLFTQQHLQQMEVYAPETRELRAYQAFTGDCEKLSRADRFGMMMSTIPCYRERVHTMAFKSHFSDKIEEIQPDFEDIIAASSELQNSPKFKKILELILAMGNYMNAGNVRVGGATGFRISYLTKLDSTKTSDNKSTLVHFLVKTIQAKYPTILSVSDELKHMAAAAKVSTQTLATEVSELKQGLEAIDREAENYSRLHADSAKDQFVQYTAVFVADARERMQSLLDLQRRMTVEYEKTVQYFGEDPAKMRSDEFFAIFHQFLGTFERALQHNINKEEERIGREKREKERQEIVNRKRSSAVGETILGNAQELSISGKEELKSAVERRHLDPSRLTALETRKPQSEGGGSLSEDFQTFLQQKRRGMKPVKVNEVSKDASGKVQEDALKQAMKRRQIDPSKFADLETKKNESRSDIAPTDFRSVLNRKRKKAVSFADESEKREGNDEGADRDFDPETHF